MGPPTCEPKKTPPFGLQDELAPLCSPSSSAPRGLPFPGKLVDGVHEVTFREL